VLALQEVDRRRARTRFADQAARVARACGMTHAFGAALRHGWGGYGNALFVRGHLADVAVVDLPRVRPAEPRVAVVARAEVAGVGLSVAVTHLSVRRPESAPQLDATVAAVRRFPGPWLVAGDLNRGPADVEPAFATAGFALADPTLPTFPTVEPRARIDHVAVAGARVGAVDVRALPVSDHRALLVEVVVG
jgi:endonuclease/exonuclease/phosphatase family metal-dependent hydrolase